MMRLRAASAGADAQRALAGGVIEVIASFERSAYLRGAHGELACLGAAALGAGPRNVLCEAPRGGWASLGLRGGVRGAALGAVATLGAVRLDWREARTWAPPSLGDVDWRARLPGALEVVATLAREAPAHGFAPLLPGAAAGRRSILLDAARPRLDALGAWVAGDADTPEPAAALVGLGPGLTPSGDDVLAAALVTLRALGATAFADTLARVVGAAAGRTGEISRAHLASAARGAGGAALHGLLGAIASSDADAIGDAARALTRTGHSSGWDALAGVACVGAAWLRRR